MLPGERLAVRVAVLMGGAVLMALEVAGFRIIGRNFGSALRETTTVIAVFLTAMSAGYYLGGRVADRKPHTSTLSAALFLAAATTLIIPALEEWVAQGVAGSAAAMAVHAFITTTLLFAVPTMLLASISPIAIRLFAVDTGHTGSVAGSMSALSTIGSVAGSVLTAFFLLDWVGSINTTVTILGITLIALALLVGAFPFARSEGGGRLRVWRLAGAAATLALIVSLGLAATAYTRAPALERSVAGTRILLERDSPYHRIIVIERPGGVRELIMDTDLHTKWSMRHPFTKGLDYTEYVHIPRIIRPGIKRVMIIGLGGGTLARQYTEFYPGTVVDAAEVDPAVIDAARRFFGVEPGPRLSLHALDGRAFANRSDQKYDLIILDAYTRGKYGATVPPHLVTKEFFEELSEKLNDGGIVHYHVPRSRDSRFVRALYKTMAEVFPSVFIVGYTELLASTAPTHLDAENLRSRAGEVRRYFPGIDQRMATLTIEPPATADVPVLRDDYAPVDMLFYDRK